MKRQRIFVSVLALGLLLALAVGLSQAQGPEPPEGEMQPQGEVSIAATVSSKFSYQGVLRENGSPVTGSRDMTFRLYSEDTCTTQVGSDIVINGVQVSDGLFNVELDVTHSDFNGQGLWLEVEVGGTKIGCQEILAVPYALSLRPGATISDTVDGILHVRSTGTGDSDAFFAYAGGTGEAVSGYATDGYGVYGQSDSNYGVRAYSSSGVGLYASSGSDTGVWGVSNGGWAGVDGRNTTGAGVYGYSSSADGVYGYALADTKSGVYGYNAGSGYGVFGRGATGVGVFGEASAADKSGTVGWNTGSGNGVYGYSNTGVGVRAVSASSGGTALYVHNHVGGDLIEAYSYLFFPDREFYVSGAGEVYADGTFHAGGADFAEMLPAAEGLEPGDVLVVGLDGELTRSTQPYQASVVGVYSTQPGFVGGAGDDTDLTGKIPLTVIGVVPVKVTAENGPIHPGDLLTTSSAPGHAMRADPNPPVGTVIGKALEGLDEGAGVIQMLVMLQ